MVDILGTIRSLTFGEQIIKLCMVPRSTSEIKTAFDGWGSRYFFIVTNLTEHLQKLEAAQAIEYVNGKWQVTKDAKELVEKYLG